MQTFLLGERNSFKLKVSFYKPIPVIPMLLTENANAYISEGVFIDIDVGFTNIIIF